MNVVKAKVLTREVREIQGSAEASRRLVQQITDAEWIRENLNKWLDLAYGSIKEAAGSGQDECIVFTISGHGPDQFQRMRLLAYKLAEVLRNEGYQTSERSVAFSDDNSEDCLFVSWKWVLIERLFCRFFLGSEMLN